MGTDFNQPHDAYERPEHWVQHTQILLDSYVHWVGEQLIDRAGSPDVQAERLFLAPMVVVSHDTQRDPILTYGNRTALQLWEMDIATLLCTPSRMTAEPMHRDERARLLERTHRHGFVDDYQGIRISQSGRRFRIDRATVWNLVGPDDRPLGQAATFASWRDLA